MKKTNPMSFFSILRRISLKTWKTFIKFQTLKFSFWCFKAAWNTSGVSLLLHRERHWSYLSCTTYCSTCVSPHFNGYSWYIKQIVRIFVFSGAKYIGYIIHKEKLRRKLKKIKILYKILEKKIETIFWKM